MFFVTLPQLIMPQGSVPQDAKLYYEVELLRCQTFTIGLACCSEEAFPCIDKDKAPPPGIDKLAAE